MLCPARSSRPFNSLTASLFPLLTLPVPRAAQERMHGLATGVEDFGVAVKRAVPRGAAFRGFPILFNHASPGRMLDALLAAPAARDILEVRVTELAARVLCLPAP